MDEVLSAIRETQVMLTQEQDFKTWNWDLISTILEVGIHIKAVNSVVWIIICNFKLIIICMKNKSNDNRTYEEWCACIFKKLIMCPFQGSEHCCMLYPVLKYV